MQNMMTQRDGFNITPKKKVIRQREVHRVSGIQKNRQ